MASIHHSNHTIGRCNLLAADQVGDVQSTYLLSHCKQWRLPNKHDRSCSLRVPVPLDPVSTIVLRADRLDLVVTDWALPELLRAVLFDARHWEDLVALATARYSTSVLVAAAVPAPLKHESKSVELKNASIELAELLQQVHELWQLPQLMDV